MMDEHDIKGENGKVLALDLGFEATGWALIHHHYPVNVGVIRTQDGPDKKKIGVARDDFARCKVIADGLAMLVQSNYVNFVTGEVPHGGSKSSRAGRCMGMALAVAAGVLGDWTCAWVSPRDVKLAVCNDEKATKTQVINKIVDHYHWSAYKQGNSYMYRCDLDWLTFNKKDFEHIADAIGAYWAFLEKWNNKEVIYQ